MPFSPSDIGLLVSVRSRAEAEDALLGGADLIDVKDPALGSLGRAEERILGEIQKHVDGRRPISAALGELIDHRGDVPPGFDFVKWGLAGLGSDAAWPKRWQDAAATVNGCQTVVVAYADWECAQAPPIDTVADFAFSRPGSILLIDTHCKEKTLQGHRATLLDWLPLPWLDALVRKSREAQVRVALAGSLGFADIEKLRDLRPAWIAVRGAACSDQDRAGAIDPARVRHIKALLKEPVAMSAR